MVDQFRLKQMPEDWAMISLGRFVHIVTDSCNPSDMNGRPYLGLEHLKSGFPSLKGVGKSEDVSSAKTIFQEQDVLYGKLRPYLRKAILAPFDGICSTDIIVMRAGEQIRPEFLLYLTHSDQFVHHAIATTSGVNHPRTSWSKLKAFIIPLPPLPEQRCIAAILTAVQRAIEQQERLIALTTELKKALMQKLFTEGTRGEHQKMTEIGPVPESWEIYQLEELAQSFTYGTSVKCDYGLVGYPVLRIPNVVGGHIDVTDLKHGVPKPYEKENLLLKRGDLLFVRTNGVQENAGRCSMYRGELGDNCYFASYLIRVRLDAGRIIPEFVEEYSRTEIGSRFLGGKAVRTADGKFNINTGTLKDVLVPFPKLDQQVEIVDMLALIDDKSAELISYRQSLIDLFRTLLHQLMTAQIRVNDVDLSELNAIGIELD